MPESCSLLFLLIEKNVPCQREKKVMFPARQREREQCSLPDKVNVIYLRDREQCSLREIERAMFPTKERERAVFSLAMFSESLRVVIKMVIH